MKKVAKLKKLVGATVCFNVRTPYSGEGELEQHVILQVDEVFRAENKKHYVKGIALKRIQHSADTQYRQYQIDRIVNRTLAIVSDNRWSKKQRQLTRLTDKRARQVEPSLPMMTANVDMRKLRHKRKRKHGTSKRK